MKEEGERSILTRKKLCIAVPASAVSDTPHLREKTSKIGSIGRAAAIFRVDEIIVYPDNPKVDQNADARLIATLLSYIETPQYLRKRLFKLLPELQYAGILPPLRTPHHPLNDRIRNLKNGEYREGVILSKTKQGSLADIGVEKPILIPNGEEPIGRRVTVKVVAVKGGIEAELSDRDAIPMYWGYVVTTEGRPLGKMLKTSGFDLIIATSRKGPPFNDVAGELSQKWTLASRILVAFGSPTKGLNEIVATEGLSLEEIVDFVVNTVPSQGTETVRTEEALLASLAILNTCLRL